MPLNITESFRLFSSLTGEQKTILAEKKVEGSHTPSEWLALLLQVGEYDRSADALRRAIGWTTPILIIVGIITGIFSGNILFAAPFIALAIVAIILYTRLKANDVSNMLREFIIPLVTLLREDIESDQMLGLKMSLDGARVKSKQISSERIPGGGEDNADLLSGRLDVGGDGACRRHVAGVEHQRPGAGAGDNENERARENQKQDEA